MPEDNVEIGIDLRTENAIRDARQLGQEIERTINELNTGNVDANMQNIINNLSRSREQLEQMASSMEEFGQSMVSTRTETEEYIQLGERFNELLRMSQEHRRALDQMRATGTATTEDFNQWGARMDEIANERNAIAQRRAEMRADGSQFTQVQGNTTQEYQNRADALNQATQAAQQFLNSIREINHMEGTETATADRVIESLQHVGDTMEENHRTLRDMAGGAMNRLRTGLQHVGGAFGQLGNRARTALRTMRNGITRIFTPFRRLINHIREGNRGQTALGRTVRQSMRSIARYILAFIGLRAILRRLTQYAREAFQVMAQQIPEVNTAISNILTNFRQLKATAGTMFQPLLQTLEPIINAIIQKITALMETIAKLFAQLSGQNYIYKATTQYYDYAKAVDEANGSLASFDKLNTISSGQKDGMGLTPDNTKYAKEYFDTIDLGNNKVIKALKRAWDRLKTTLLNVWELIKKIGISFRDAWNTGIGEELLSHITGALDNILLIIDNLSISFGKAWETDGTGQKILEDILGIFSDIWGFVEDITGATAEWAINVDFLPALQGLEGVLSNVRGILQKLLSIVKRLYTKYILPMMTWMIETVIPKLETIATDILSEINTVLEWLEPKLSWIMDNVIAPIAGALGEAFTGILDKVHEVLETKIKPVLSDLRTFIDEKVWPALQNIFGFIQMIAVPLIEGFGKTIEGLIGTAGDVIGNLEQIFEGLIDFLTGVFTLDWDKAWDGIKKIFFNIVNGIIGAVEGLINAIVDGINCLGGLVGIELDHVSFGRLGESSVNRVPTEADVNALKEKLAKGELFGDSEVMSSMVASMIQMYDESKRSETAAGTLDVANLAKNAVNDIIDSINNMNKDNPLFMKIPKLAQGAVLPPNKPFLAMVGDQSRGTNVEAPLSTIEKAVANVLQNITLKAEFDVSGDPKGLFKVIRKEAKVYYNQTGNNAYAVN